MQRLGCALTVALVTGVAGCTHAQAPMTAATPADGSPPQRPVLLQGKLTLKGPAERPTVYLQSDSGELWEARGVAAGRVAEFQGRRVQVAGQVVRAAGGFVTAAVNVSAIAPLD